jgi:hypothetical protein
MMKKGSLVIFILSLGCYAFSNEIGLRDELKEKVLVKPIFDYFVKSEYQNKYKFIYEIYKSNPAVLGLDEAFQIISQPENEMAFKNIKGILKFLVQPDKLKQGCTNEIQENHVGRKRGNFSAALWGKAGQRQILCFT